MQKHCCGAAAAMTRRLCVLLSLSSCTLSLEPCPPCPLNRAPVVSHTRTALLPRPALPAGTGLFKLLQDVGPQDSWLGVAAGAGGTRAGVAAAAATGGVAGTAYAAVLGIQRPPPLLAYAAL